MESRRFLNGYNLREGHHTGQDQPSLETPANLFPLRNLQYVRATSCPFFTPHQSLQGKDQETQKYGTIIKYNGLGYNNLNIVVRGV